MTVRETLLPSAIVPGLVTIEDKDGNQQNLYPIDAKELIASGDYTLVENGAVESARMAATPLRSGMAAGIPSDQLVVEISGIEGRVVVSDDADAVRAASAGIDGTTAEADKKAAPVAGKSAGTLEAEAAQAAKDEKAAAAPAAKAPVKN